jgi:uridine kinase
MTNKKINVGVMVDPEYKDRFAKRCIDYKTTRAEVLRTAINNWMESHPPKEEKFTGIT